MRTTLAICLSALMFPTIATAQVAPKLCVTVARDPDTTTRAIAERIHDLAARTTAVRTVGDAQARAALRGELATSPDDATLAALVRHRRSLAFADADARPLAAIAESLGCAQIAVVSATPRGISLRRFDVLANRYDLATEAAEHSDAALSTRFALPAPSATNSTAATSTTSNTAVATASASTTATASSTNNASTHGNATTTPNASANPTTTSTTTTTTSTTPSTTSSTTSTTTNTSSSTPPNTSTTAGAPRVTPTPRATQRPDPRVTVTRPSQPQRSTPVWAWVIAGVAGAGLVGGFIAAQTIGPSVPLVRVSGPGAAP